jgi:hypothetical protein
MPISLAKGGKRPAEPRERNTAIHHWSFFEIRNVIESDEAMPDHLGINPKRHYRQTEQDEEVGSLECCSSACVSIAFPRTEKGILLPACGDTPVFSLLRGPFRHAFCETIRLARRTERSN